MFGGEPDVAVDLMGGSRDLVRVPRREDLRGGDRVAGLGGSRDAASVAARADVFINVACAAMGAGVCLIAWNLASGRPNWTRSVA